MLRLSKRNNNDNRYYLVEIEPGDSGIIPNYGLEYNDDGDGENVRNSI